MTMRNEEVTYPVLELFATRQGEGAWTAHPAVFIRLAGCSVGCFWCDTPESWDVAAGNPMSVAEIVRQIQRFGKKMVVITGGEPAEHDLRPLTTALKAAGLQVHLETSGSAPLRGDFDWITLSPKKFKMPLPEAYHRANELKVIVYNRHDLTFALQEGGKVSASCLKFVQPEWSRRHKMLPHIVEFLKQHPDWLLSLQVHKYWRLP